MGNSKRYWQVTATRYEFSILSQISIIKRGRMRDGHGTGLGVGYRGVERRVG